MNRIITCLLAITCSIAAAEDTGEFPIFKTSDTESILAKAGQKITVRGTVSEARKSKGGTNFISFINSEFYLVTFKSDLKAFKNKEPADLYKKKHLAITGVISIYKNKPQMRLNHPNMVKIISEDEPILAPEKVKKRNTTKRQPLTQSPEKLTAEIKKQIPPVDPKKYFK